MRGGAALACLLLGLAGAARAHQTRLSRGELRAGPGAVELQLRFAAADLRAAGLLGEEPGARAPLAGLLAGPAGAALLAETVGSVELRTSARCALAPGALASPDGDDGIELRGAFGCPAAARLEGSLPFLDRLGAGHTLLLQIFLDGDGPHDRVLQPGAASFSAEAGEAASAAALRFFGLGLQHIAGGLDHLAFLVALLLLGGALGRLALVVTAFTAAHSVTLALAALGLFSLSPRIVEPLIAASIAAVAGENLWALRAGPEAADRALRHRWAIAFGFGLVHGFGFADGLREAGLPRAHLAAALASFNLGVESGQLLAIAAALPLVRTLLRSPLAARGPRALSAALGALGVVWMALRLRG